MPLNNNQPWNRWEKIIFRFFFLFLTLQILTQDFLGNLFGGARFIWELGDHIFTRPGLWLNNRFFHFTYLPPAWTTFSAALHTIRDTVYFLLSIVICIVWTILDKRRTNYNRLLYWFSRVLIMVLSCIAFAYGIVKVFPVQMAAPSFSVLLTPVGNLRPFDLLWTTYGYGSPYQTFTGICEAASAILILFNRTRVVGLLVITSVMVNVIMLNYTFQIGVLMLSFYVLLVTLFLLAPYAGQLSRFFFTHQSSSLTLDTYKPMAGPKTQVPKIVAGVLIAASFIANTIYVHNVYERRAAVKRSAQYYRVKSFVINGDTLRPPENDTICWRWWNERTTGGKRYVTITPMKLNGGKTYTVSRDTAKSMLSLQAIDKKDSARLNFCYMNLNAATWQMEGMLGQNRVRIEFQRIDPDTVFQLQRTKHTIIALNDDKDQ